MGEDRRREAAARARRALPGYDRWLDAHGWSAELDVPPPVTTKADLFGEGLRGWMPKGALAGVAEVITSSGHGGRFSMGLVPAEAAERLGATVDGMMALLGADGSAPGLLLNCLPQGIAVPPGGALLANCGVNIEAALAILRDVAPAQGPCILVGEPILVKELVERGARSGPGWAPERLLVVAGGEWVAESLRAHVESLLPSGGPGMLVSCGTAEIGLHAFAEDPVLRAIRGALAAHADLRRDLLGEDRGVAPLVLGYDPEVLLLDEPGAGAPRLVVTTLDERPLPLVRYDLGDRGRPLSAERVGEIARALGIEAVTGPAILHEGRLSGDGNAEAAGPTVEAVKEALFSDSAWAFALTGRFRLTIRRHGTELDLETHDPLPPEARVPGLPELGERLGLMAVRAHPGASYPHHRGGHGRKPQYLEECL